MRRSLSLALLALVPLLVAFAPGRPTVPRAQKGPFNPEAFPPTIDLAKQVHFISIDNAFSSPGGNWTPNLKILTGGDHATEAVTVGGHTGVRVMGIKFNTADDLYPLWAKETTIDILMQVYGDGVFLNDDGSPRYCDFLTGTLPEPIAVVGGEIPAAAKNQKWNWVLFRISNGLRHMDGGRLVGTIHPKAKNDPGIAEVSRLSGQNGGTIRMDGLHDLKARFVAFGQKGAFGEPEQINRFRR
jgi:hypothetical protein